MSEVVATVQVELLLNRAVRDLDDKVVGHIEEIVAEREGDELFVTEFHTGGYGMLEHLSAITVGEWLLRLLGRRPHGHIIRWNQLDLTDPEHPRLTCARSEVERHG